MTDKPLLLIDVDGPLNPYAQSYSQLRKEKKFKVYRLLGYKVWLNRWHGEELNKLAELYELVWCTTWEHSANELIGPRIGLPELPVIEFGKNLPDKPPVRGLYWKSAVILEYTDNRPFVWLDDECQEVDADYFKANRTGKFAVLPVSPITGLITENFADVREWHIDLTRYNKAKELLANDGLEGYIP